MNRKLKIIEKQKQEQENFKKIYFMQAVALANYAKLCNQLNVVPKLDVIDILLNSEDVKKLIEANKMFVSQLKQ